MDDIASLRKLDDQSALQLLKERFSKDLIYTYAGETLVKIAPVRDLDIHGKAVSDNYHLSTWRQKPAHLFAFADDVYQEALGKRGSEPNDQCIVLRGMSGSGKTEAANRIVRHLVITSGIPDIQRKALQVSAVLEAFGNARTALNKSASRFANHTTLYLSQGKVVGLRVNEFFLEKWRVTNQGQNDTNFLIFYYILAGQGFSQRMKEHRYLQNREVLTSPRIGLWAKKCEAVVNALGVLGFSNQEQTDINLLLLSILSLGNITVARSKVGEAILEPDHAQKLKNVADFLGLNAVDLEETICCSEVIVNAERIQKKLTRDEAEDVRDALAQDIYHRLFAWIIFRINGSMRPTPGNTPDREIGILDMPGFESISHNSFEQCCINFMEEILHGLYAEYMYRVTEEECRQEGVSWHAIDVPINDDIMDLFLVKPGGLLSVVDKESQAEKASDDDFISKLTNALKDKKTFESGSSATKHLFALKHHIEKVTYDARGWMTKNHFPLSPATVLMMQNAENTLLSTLFKGKFNSRGSLSTKQTRVSKKQPVPKSRVFTTTTHVKNSVQAFLEKTLNVAPHFVSCIKPTPSKKDSTFDDKFVLNQMKWLGVVPAARVYSEGFTACVDQQQFAESYQNSCGTQISSNDSSSDKCRSILTAFNLTGWEIGKSKVFLTGNNVKILSQLPSNTTANSQPGATGEEKSIYCFAHPVSPLADIAQPSLAVPNYALVMPKALRRQARNSAYGRINKSLVKSEKKSEDSGSSESDFETIEENFLTVRRQEMSREVYGEVGTRAATVRWFKQTQANALKATNGYIEWCHGIITRKQAEDLLCNKPIGCFLARLSETRFGYTLSFKDVDRCRHYMIEQLLNANYRVTGEIQEHNSLCDLVSYYKKNKLTNWNGVLTVPCGQKENDCDYLELLLTKDDEEQLKRMMNTARLVPSAPEYESRRVGSPGPAVVPPPRNPNVESRPRREPVPSPPQNALPPLPARPQKR